MKALRCALTSIALVAGLAATGVGRPADAASEAPEKQGCCSHHKGVWGCSGGRAQCCDGTLSPTCGCD